MLQQLKKPLSLDLPTRLMDADGVSMGQLAQPKCKADLGLIFRSIYMIFFKKNMPLALILFYYVMGGTLFFYVIHVRDLYVIQNVHFALLLSLFFIGLIFYWSNACTRFSQMLETKLIQNVELIHSNAHIFCIYAKNLKWPFAFVLSLMLRHGFKKADSKYQIHTRGRFTCLVFLETTFNLAIALLLSLVAVMPTPTSIE
ncbi:hypothetical protein ACJX0J_015217 [Zea mays]